MDFIPQSLQGCVWDRVVYKQNKNITPYTMYTTNN